MKQRFFYALLSCLLLSGLTACDMFKDSQDTVKEGANTTIQQIDRARVLSDLTSITAALQSYRLQYEKYPASLDELKLQLNHPEDLVYDPEKGQVRSKTFPDL